MRIGIFGGTFDPPHIGHLILASEASFYLKLSQVLWVVTSQPPHKQNQSITPLSQRIEMVKAAISAEPLFSLSLIEAERPNPQYVVDTMRLLRSRYPNYDLIYLMGGDSLYNLPSWYMPRQFISYCTQIGVMHRIDVQINVELLEKELPGISEKIVFIPTPRIEVSSNNIRNRIAQNQPFRFFLPESVYQCILEKKIYRS